MSSNPAVTIGVTAVDKASGVLKSLDQQVAGTTSKVEQSNEKLAKTTERASGKMIKSYANIATSVASLGAGIVSFTTSFGNLEKAQYRVDTANLSLQKSQAALEKLQASGKATTEQLALAQEDMRVKSEQLRIAQGDLSDTTMNFYAQMPAQLISFGTAATSALTAYSTGAKGATLSTQTLGHAFKVAMLGPPPIGLILTGVGIAATLVATHFDEISAALQYAGDVVHDFLTVHFKPLADLIDWFIDGLNALGAGLKTDAVPAFDAASSTVADFNGELTNTQVILGTGLPSAVTVAEQSLHGLNEKIDSTAKRARTLNEMVNSFNRGESGVTYTSEPIKHNFREPMVKVNGRWVPKDDYVFGNTTSSLQDYIQRRNYSKSFDNGFDLSSIQALERRFDKPALDIEISFVDKGTHYEVTATGAGKSRTFIAQKKTYMRDMIA